MTLISAISYSDEFVLVTGDKRQVKVLEDGTLILTPVQRQKVHKLTDRVLLAKSGDGYITDIIKDELFKIVHSDYDLKQCADVLKNITNDYKKDQIYDIEDNASVLLSGFYLDGKTGSVLFNTQSNHISEAASDQCKFQHTINFPNYIDESTVPKIYLTQFEPLENDKELDPFKVTARLMSIYKLTSYLMPDKISSDYDCYILYRDGNELKFESKYYDVSLLYKTLPPVDQVKDFYDQGWDELIKELGLKGYKSAV